MVIVSGPNMVDELKKRPEEELSVMDGLLEVRSPMRCFASVWLTVGGQLVQLQYMIGRASKEDPAHSIVVHEKLTARRLSALVPELAEEIQLAVQEHLPPAGSGKFS